MNVPDRVVSDAPAIEARCLTKYYGSSAVLRELSFQVPRGQVAALLGPNGAGKSTTMRILAGCIGSSKGTALVSGFDVRIDRRAACAAVGYLPEGGPLYPDMTPRQMLTFFGQARGLPTELLEARLREVAERCEIEPILNKPIGKLSKGIRQRVGLAHALLHDPDVLIMDEPTEGLDPNQVRHFRDLVRRLQGRKTLLISTHLLQEVEASAERVLLIHQGQLAYDGSLSSMMEQGSLEEPFYRLTHSSGAPL